MLTQFRRFLGLATMATKEDARDVIAKLQKAASAPEVHSHPYLITNVQTFAERREVTLVCRKTRRRVARVNLVPGQKPDVSWGVRWV